jgi:hypothetical protein
VTLLQLMVPAQAKPAQHLGTGALLLSASGLAFPTPGTRPPAALCLGPARGDKQAESRALMRCTAGGWKGLGSPPPADTGVTLYWHILPAPRGASSEVITVKFNSL